jgi:hypothetical protein
VDKTQPPIQEEFGLRWETRIPASTSPHICRRKNDVRNVAEARQEFLANGGRENSNNNPVHVYGVKRKNILYELEYWKV